MAPALMIFCFSPQSIALALFLWVLTLLLTCFVCLFGAYFVYLTWKIDKSVAMKKIKPVCTFITICFMLNTILFTYHVYSSIYCLYGYDIQAWVEPGFTALFFNQLGMALLYLLFVYRLSYPFHGTVLQISNLFYAIFIIGFILMIVLGNVSIAVLDMGIDHPEYFVDCEDLGFAIRVSYQISVLLFTIILLSVFVKKILLLQDVQLLKRIVRIIICAALGLLSSQLLDSVLAVVRIYYNWELIWTAHIMCVVLDQVINLLSIYLQFPFGEKAFERICGGLQKRCSRHVINISNLKDVVEMQSNTNIKTEPSTNATASTGTTDTTGTADTTGTLSPDFVQNTSTTDKTLPEVTVEDTI